MSNKKIQEVAQEVTVNVEAQVETPVVAPVVEDAQSDGKDEAPKAPTFPVQKMRKCIIAAADNGNKHAITATEASMAGVDADTFNEYCNYVLTLREAVREFNDIRLAYEFDAEKFAIAKQRCYDAWREVLKRGEEHFFHPKMFVRNQDLYSFAGFDAAVMVVNGVPVQTHTTISTFRKHVERFIAMRIASNDALNDKDRDDLKRYAGAMKTVETMTKKLDGDEKTVGIKGQITNMKTRIEELNKLADDAKLSDEQRAKILSADSAILKDLEKQQKQAEGLIKSNTKTIEELKTRCEMLIATIKKIEGVED